jgi:hypothetical protein
MQRRGTLLFDFCKKTIFLKIFGTTKKKKKIALLAIILQSLLLEVNLWSFFLFILFSLS